MTLNGPQAFPASQIPDLHAAIEGARHGAFLCLQISRNIGETPMFNLWIIIGEKWEKQKILGSKEGNVITSSILGGTCMTNKVICGLFC